ncbi:hypothetical protein CASFOL_037242 [Castilleja foliolosa]|uniref:Uncharacterized protein n=1 Tax=Castilleja foliolosa TaxID=1961234 RepID=A0ABD3BPE5_9LAMI
MFGNHKGGLSVGKAISSGCQAADLGISYLDSSSDSLFTTVVDSNHTQMKAIVGTRPKKNLEDESFLEADNVDVNHMDEDIDCDLADKEALNYDDFDKKPQKSTKQESAQGKDQMKKVKKSASEEGPIKSFPPEETLDENKKHGYILDGRGRFRQRLREAPFVSVSKFALVFFWFSFKLGLCVGLPE